MTTPGKHRKALQVEQSITIFLLFFLAFVIWPFGGNPYEPPKVIVAMLGVELLLFATVVRKKFFIQPISKVVLTIYLCMLIQSMMHLLFFRTDTTLFGNAIRLQGVIMLWHLLLFAYVGSRLQFKDVPSAWHWLCLFGLGMAALLFGQNTSYRLYGTFGEPNALAAYIIFLLPFGMLIRDRLRTIIYCIMAVGIIMGTKSDAAMLAVILELVFLIFVTVTKRKTVPFLLCILLLVTSFVYPFLSKPEKSVYPESQVWRDSRAAIWITSFHAGLKKPFIGWGFGNTEYALQKTAWQIQSPLRFQYVDSAHNIFLDWWVQGGGIGLGLLLGLLIIAVQNFLRQKRTLELTTILGLLTVLSFNPVSVAVLVVFWWTIGLGVFATTHE